MAKSPLLLGQRHPRYTVALVAFFLCAYWFLSKSPPPPRPVKYTPNHDLKARLEREERKYRAMLPQRQALITRFGPTPADVVMYVARPCLSISHPHLSSCAQYYSGSLQIRIHGLHTLFVSRTSRPAVDARSDALGQGTSSHRSTTVRTSWIE